MNAEWVVIGLIVAAHGVKGEVRVRCLSDSPDRFANLRQCYLRTKSGEVKPCHIRSAKQLRGMHVLGIDGVNNRDDAEILRGCELVVTRNEVGPLPKGSYYIFDIVGLRAITPTGTLLGRIKDVLANPANDVYVLERPGRPDCYIPAIKQVVKEINIPSGHVVISPWPGMVDGEEEQSL